MSVQHNLPKKRLLQLPEIIAPHGPIPLRKSAWWEGVKKGIFPQPVKFGPRTTAWKAEDIENLINNGID